MEDSKHPVEKLKELDIFEFHTISNPDFIQLELFGWIVLEMLELHFPPPWILLNE